jgi:trk system potassium uptake protein TrkA
VLQDGDQLVVAVTDEITGRVHHAVENAPQGGGH